MIVAGTEANLRYKTPFFPYVTLFGIWSQVICLVIMVFMPDLQAAFLTGVPMLIAPMVWYKLRAKRRAALAR